MSCSRLLTARHLQFDVSFELCRSLTRDLIPLALLHLGDRKEVTVSRTSSFGSDQELKRQQQNATRFEDDRRTLSSLDNITQPVSHHPPARAHRDQQHVAQVTSHSSAKRSEERMELFTWFLLSKEIDVEPMAVREETALENDVSYDGSLGRASLHRAIQSLNAPKSVSGRG